MSAIYLGGNILGYTDILRGIDKADILCLHITMPPKGPQGNKDQLMMALELSKGLSTKEVAELLDKPLVTVQKLQKKMKDGWQPDLSEEAIAAAPQSPGKMMPGNTLNNPPQTVTPEPKGKGKSKPKTPEEILKDSHPASGYIGFAAIQLKCQYTPIMYMARVAAEEKWGWSGKMAIEDFFDTVLYHFFKDRGITLQGYIVDEEVDGSGNGEYKALQKKIEDLTALITAKKAEEG